MEIKMNFLKGLTEFNVTSQKYELGSNLINEIECLRQEIENFKIKVPFVGRFNAGKSALLNRFIKSDVLVEEGKPETSIAAELRYGSDGVIIHNSDGSISETSLEKMSTIDPEKCLYVEIMLNNDVLKKLDRDIILVDMPGFDSNIKAHNTAINNYIGQGTFFIIVVDQADGGIKPNVMKFLNEIDSYRANFSVLVNKSEKIPEENAGRITNGIRNLLAESGYDNVEVEKTSIYFDDTPEKLLHMINSINKDELYNKFFADRYDNLGRQIIKGLMAIQNSLSLNTDEINLKIKQLESSMDELRSKLQKERKKLQRKMREVVPVEIVDDVRQTIIANAHSLARSAVSSSQTFGQVLNNLIRPVLVQSTGKHIDCEMSEFEAMFESNFEDIENIVGGIKDKVNTITGSVQKIAKIADAIEITGKMSRYYKIATTTLAVFTSTIAPWLELIIIFLPDILKLLGIGTEERKIEKIEEQIRNELAYEITEKLKPEIVSSLSEMEDEMTESIEKRFSDELQVLSSALESTRKSSKEEKEKHEEIKLKISQDIQTINNLLLA